MNFLFKAVITTLIFFLAVGVITLLVSFPWLIFILLVGTLWFIIYAAVFGDFD